MRFSNAGQFVPVKFAEPRQPSAFSRQSFMQWPLALFGVGIMVAQADETQAGSQSVPCECPIASPAHFFFRRELPLGFLSIFRIVGGADVGWRILNFKRFKWRGHRD
jgi:hypothetical protein